MIIVCQKCDSRLQVDEARVPSQPFVIRCPKCHSSVDSGLPSLALEQSGAAIGVASSTEEFRFEQPNPAPLFELHKQPPTEPPTGASSTDKLAELLSGLMSQPTAAGGKVA